MIWPAESPAHQGLGELIDRVRSDPRYDSLLRQFWKEGSSVQGLLGLPRERLLPRASAILSTPIPSFFDVQLPYFPFAEPVSYEQPSSPASVSEAPVETQSDDDVEDEDEEDPFGFASDKEMQRTIAHGIILTIRHNPSLVNCVVAPDYDWNMLLRETRDLSEVDLSFLESTDFFQRLQESAPLKITPEDKDVDKLLKRIAQHLTEPFRRDPLFLLRFFGEKLDRLGGVQGLIRDKLSSYLQVLGISYTEYRDALQQLAKHDLLPSYGCVMACRKCEYDGSPSVLFSFSKLSTDGLRPECPRCRESMEAAILYGIDDFLYELITFPDSFLTIALAWLFEQAGVEWRYSSPLPDGECDFLIRKGGRTVAIEVKMLDSRSRMAGMRIQEGVRQAANAAKQLDALEAWLVFQGPTIAGLKSDLDQSPRAMSSVHLVEFFRMPELLGTFGS
jgi:hypothetical protein